MSAPTLKFSLDSKPLLAALGALSGAASKTGMAAVLKQAELIMTDAKRMTPVDTGALRSSGTVTLRGKAVDLTFGSGASGAYAIYVHENLSSYHPVGSAKFLENAMNNWQARGGMQALGQEIGRALGKAS